MNIVTAFEQNAVEGHDGDHDHVVETVLSKLFFRGDRVLKAYKHRTADFADLSDSRVRRAYISEDFHWNKILSPEIYLALHHVKIDGDRLVHTHEDHATDHYIVMRKIDASHNLLSLITSGTLKESHLTQYATILIDRLSSLTQTRSRPLMNFFERGHRHVREEILGTSSWAYTATPHLEKKDVDAAHARLSDALSTHPYFNTEIPLSIVIDSNPENIVIVDGNMTFLDVMPPKDSWRVHDPYFALCRTSADISALCDTKMAEILHQSYASQRQIPPREVRDAYEIAATLIQVPYRVMLGQHDLARAYARFLKSRLAKV
jgi:aminoglycoside phosphotransferase family enzyme